MSPPPHGDELASSFPHQSIPLDLPKTPAADPAAQTPHMHTGFDNYDFMFPASPQIAFDGFAVQADVTEDGRRPCGTDDADMLWINDDADAAPQAAPPVPLGVGEGGHAAAPCCATSTCTTTGFHFHQHLPEEEDARRRFDSWTKSHVEQHLMEEKVALTSAPEDGRPSDTDADIMPEVNDSATQPEPGPLPVSVQGRDVEEKVKPGLHDSFLSAIVLDLHHPYQCVTSLMASPSHRFAEKLRQACEIFLRNIDSDFNQDRKNLELLLGSRCVASMVRFTGPDSKGRKPHQPRCNWKETSMTGMRAVLFADPSSPQPPEQQEQQQQRYVGLKKTLELDDDGNGNRWRAHEYTPLLPSDDGTDKLVPAEMSLRVEFKVEEPAPSSAKEDDEPAAPSDPPAFSLPSKRSRSGAPKAAPKKSPVWNHMTKVHVKVPAATNTDGSSQRKKNPCYKVMFAICHHCDRVFNADSEHHGTNNLRKHLDTCNHCCCAHSHSP